MSLAFHDLTEGGRAADKAVTGREMNTGDSKTEGRLEGDQESKCNITNLIFSNFAAV